MAPFHRFFYPVFIAALSTTFLSFAPHSEQTDQRKISSCAEASSQSFGGESTDARASLGLFGFLQDANARRSAESYSLFLRQMEISSLLFGLNAQSALGFRVPSFPSYSLPSVLDYSVSTRRPDSSNQIFGGLRSNPQLQYLLSASSAAGSQNSLGSNGGWSNGAAAVSPSSAPVNFTSSVQLGLGRF